MGQTLSEPVTNKETAICQDDFYKVNFSMIHGILEKNISNSSKIIALYKL